MTIEYFENILHIGITLTLIPINYAPSLTMLGIIIGVGSVIALMSVGRGAQASILSTYDRLGTNMLAVVPTSGRRDRYGRNFLYYSQPYPG